jgi:hypothetical protein
MSNDPTTAAATYFASEISIEERDAALAEAAELALADYHQHIADCDNAAYWASLHEREDDPEDRYLDSRWEDANEYGMDGCCGDF